MTDRKKDTPRMQSNSTSFPEPEHIREKAEQKAKSIPPPNLDSMTHGEIQQLFYEMQVKRFEAELQNEQSPKGAGDQAEILKIVTENMLDLVALTDMEGNFTFAGKSHEILGYDPSFLIGKNVMDFVHPEDLPRILEEFDEFVASGHSLIVECRYRCKDGTHLWLEVIGNFIKIAEVEDITERKRAEEALRANEEKYRRLFESSRDAIMTLEPPSWAFTSGNPATVKMFGAKNENEFISHGPGALSPERQPDGRASAEKALEMIETAVREGSHFFEWTHRRIDGKDFPADVLLTRIEQAGKLLLQATVRDITERKQAEKEKERLQAQLNQAQKMESVGRLAGGVAHDFNNKLSIINGYAELAMETIDPSDPLHETIQEIHTARKKSADIVRQLLAFARQQNISPVQLDLNDTISSMLKMLQRLIGENIDLVWHPGSNLWPVKIDPSQIDQIMANLAVNARDAISDVGKLTIETKNTIVDEDYCKSDPEAIPGQYVMLSVSDSGSGMDRETLENLFEPFFTTKEIGKGTGLGMPTVYGIVKQNNGFINVYSEPGEGTIFKIYLPRHEEQESPALEHLKEFAEQRPTGSETILLVEDARSVLHMGRVLLEKLGYTVLTAEAPDDALQLAEEYAGRIQLLITDVIMQEMNGRDLAMRINLLRPEIKTIYISSYTKSVIAHLGVLDNGVHYIQKPFSMQELAVKVREVIEQE